MKIKLFAVLTIVTSIMFASCSTGQLKGKKLKTDVDSLSYAYGTTFTDGLIMYLEHQRGVDTAQLNSFIKGFIKGASIKTDNQKEKAYLVGLEVGQMVGGQWFEGINTQTFGDDATKSLNKNSFIAGFVASTLDKNVKMNLFEAQAYVEAKTQEIQERQMESLYGANRDEGIKFLEDNKKNDDVKVLDSGLQYKVISLGRGASPTRESTVRVHYHGTLIDGTVFDSSVERGSPAEFRVDGVIAGWTEALQLMTVGSKWMLYIPHELAYGAADMGTIRPFSTLIFEVELLEIVR